MDNSVMMQAFEWYLPDDGQYYRRMKEKVKELSEAGIDAVWLPPMFKAQGTNDVGYGVYDLYDLGEFDQKGTVRTKYGTLEELRDLIDELHRYDMKVYADVVMNHKAGADFTEEFMAVPVDPDDRNREIGESRNIEGWTGFNFPGRGGAYSDFEWHFQHFSGVDYDEKTGANGIFKIIHQDRDWNQGVSSEKGNYDYLMFADVDVLHPDVKQELFNWSRWFVDFLPIDGMRFDALKHIDNDFMEEFIQQLEEYLDRDFYFFGEFWTSDKDSNEHYLYETKYHTDLFDVGLHFNMEMASKDGQHYDMRKIFDGSIVKKYKYMAVTFVDNHDSQPGQSLESYIQEWFKKIAYGLILLRVDGYPCIFYGDYYGIEHNEITGHQDMIDNLIEIRQKYVYGEQTDYFEAPQLIGWTLSGDAKHPGSLAVVISTGDAQTLTMNVGVDQVGKTYVDLTGGNQNEIIIDEEGNGDFEVGPGTLAAWGEKQE